MIRLEKLSKAYADKIILKNVSYHFPEGERIALFGANGQGKTTLLNIITGLEEMDEGQVIKPKAMKLAFLPQSPSLVPKITILEECMSGHTYLYHLQEQMNQTIQRMETHYQDADYEAYERMLQDFDHHGGYQWEGQAQKILLGLGFKEEQLASHPQTLSGGWRMRLELAKVLIAKPDFMILDEPTNHLDLPSIEWLETYLEGFPGTLLFVSHDRSFLNHLATIVVSLKQGSLQAYTGNFDDFIHQRDQNARTQEATRKKIIHQQAHMQRFVDRFRAKASKAGQVGSRLKMIEKLKNLLDHYQEDMPQTTLHFPKLSFSASGKDVFKLKGVTIGYQQPLIRSVNLTVLRGERIAIVGANGIGKSTFLKTIGGKLLPLSGEIHQGHQVKVGFYTQDAAEQLDKNLSVFASLQSVNEELSETLTYAFLGSFLFKGNSLIKLVSVLSGGERSRLALCRLLAQSPNCLLLDEPTNHLDLASTQILAEWLRQYPGTVIFVSHDRDFVDQVATKIIEVDKNGKIIM
ncbi:MAG TPA: ABC-F family ATP-binding cassette domain-containing protein [Candidatus Nitrosotenuis sp.]|jgi:ATP-binding cassette subfamily F protein 3|nr:ABC-F family ATP-binding cassette domain-containing protein [Candidatus Nitrosotenuis sp.]